MAQSDYRIDLGRLSQVDLRSYAKVLRMLTSSNKPPIPIENTPIASEMSSGARLSSATLVKP
jgi:hypothetical protein